MKNLITNYQKNLRFLFNYKQIVMCFILATVLLVTYLLLVKFYKPLNKIKGIFSLEIIKNILKFIMIINLISYIFILLFAILTLPLPLIIFYDNCQNIFPFIIFRHIFTHCIVFFLEKLLFKNVKCDKLSDTKLWFASLLSTLFIYY